MPQSYNFRQNFQHLNFLTPTFIRNADILPTTIFSDPTFIWNVYILVLGMPKMHELYKIINIQKKFSSDYYEKMLYFFYGIQLF